MKLFSIVWAILAMAPVAMSAQSLEDLNIQIHGYATQGFLYTTNNNIFSTNSSDGSPSWTEAVVNVGAEPLPKLHVAVQTRYFLLGNYGNAITLDYAMADYKINDKIGVRFGKTKIPQGLFNEIQDIDPSYQWALLPQSIYPITSRNFVLAQYGGVVYGTLKPGSHLGKLEYRGWGGERTVSSDDGFLVPQKEAGIVLPNGNSFISMGAALHWRTPLPGLMLGASALRANTASAPLIVGGTLPGTENVARSYHPDYFGTFEKSRFMFAMEYARSPVNIAIDFTNPFIPPAHLRVDQRDWFAMASYRLTDKLTAGAYHSESFDREIALGPTRYSKDWALSGRYDFGQFLYAKAEQHFIDGTAIGYDTATNTNGLKPNTKLTVLKVGVSF